MNEFQPGRIICRSDSFLSPQRILHSIAVRVRNSNVRESGPYCTSKQRLLLDMRGTGVFCLCLFEWCVLLRSLNVKSRRTVSGRMDHSIRRVGEVSREATSERQLLIDLTSI